MSIPETLTAAVLRKHGDPLEIVDDILIPRLRDYQCLVDIHFSGVCHSQLMEARGWRGPDPFLPHMLGHEATGEIIKVGPKVKKFAPGDRVVIGWIKCTGGDSGVRSSKRKVAKK